ncbi:MAG: hypothetical protein ACI9VR_001393 [Cognaticolwellia sp.]|jgi:hypothetical protein
MSNAQQPDFTKLSGQMYELWEKSSTAWWDEVLESPAFLKSMGENLANNAEARSAYQDKVDQGLEQLHLPTRKDLQRVARIASLLEDRQLKLEDEILGLRDQLLSSERDALLARIQAAETRLELETRLSSMDAKIDLLLAQRSTAGQA